MIVWNGFDLIMFVLLGVGLIGFSFFAALKPPTDEDEKEK